MKMSNTGSIPKSSTDNLTETYSFKLYKRRWLMVIIFAVCYVCTAFQYLQFSIIANIVAEFYDVSFEAVDWTVMIQFVILIVFIFPVIYIMNKFDIRKSLIATMLLTCMASWIKVGSAAPDRFWVVILAQIFVAFSQVFISVLPARIAGVWFGAKETALACGVGVFGNQVGITLGCLIPIVLVNYSKDKVEVANDMYVLNIGLAVICSAVFVFTIAFFRSKPPTPPTGAQEQLGEIGEVQFIESTKLLFKNVSYVKFVIAFAISIGVFYTIPALLNQIILQYYENSIEEVAKIGLIFNIMGVFASVISGYTLGRLQRYRLTTISTFALYFLGMIMFTLALLHSLITVYIASVVFGFFMTATYSISLEVAAELTYPVPESTSSGYLLASSQATGIALVYLYSSILYSFGGFWANTFTCGLLLISTILVVCMKFNCRRQAAEDLHNKKVEK